MRRNQLISVHSLLVLITCSTAITVPGQEVGVVESFALAQDRAKAIEQLVPGTEAYYYYRCLERPHAGRFGSIRSSRSVESSG